MRQGDALIAIRLAYADLPAEEADDGLADDRALDAIQDREPVSRDVAEQALEHLLKRGEIYRPGDGRIKPVTEADLDRGGY